MTAPIYIGPMSILPVWIMDIEQAHFGKAWMSICENEHIWTIPSVSFARWRVVPSIQEAELLRIGVIRNWRRNGYGRAILQYSQNQVANFGISTSLLEVRTSNTVARSLYESEGWCRLSLRKQYYGDGEDAVIYQRLMLAQ